LPVDDALRAEYAFAEGATGLPVSHPAAEWLMLSWGSEAFYTTAGRYSDIQASAVWTAMTGDTSVMRLDVTSALPADLPQVTWIWLSRAQYKALLASLSHSFLRDQTGQALAHPAPGLGQSDSFWRARGQFSHGWGAFWPLDANAAIGGAGAVVERPARITAPRALRTLLAAPTFRGVHEVLDEGRAANTRASQFLPSRSALGSRPVGWHNSAKQENEKWLSARVITCI
jgi:uncharacterized protein (TIGR02117 family)